MRGRRATKLALTAPSLAPKCPTGPAAAPDVADDADVGGDALVEGEGGAAAAGAVAFAAGLAALPEPDPRVQGLDEADMMQDELDPAQVAEQLLAAGLAEADEPPPDVEGADREASLEPLLAHVLAEAYDGMAEEAGDVAAEDDDAAPQQPLDPSWSEPVCDGSRMTKRQYVFALLLQKRAGQIRNRTFDRLLMLLADHVMPAGNSAPRSLHLLKKCLEIEPAGKYEYHLCYHGRDVFASPCGCKDYHKYENEQCRCPEPVPRFRTGIDGRLQPWRVGGWKPALSL